MQRPRRMSSAPRRPYAEPSSSSSSSSSPEASPAPRTAVTRRRPSAASSSSESSSEASPEPRTTLLRTGPFYASLSPTPTAESLLRTSPEARRPIATRRRPSAASSSSKSSSDASPEARRPITTRRRPSAVSSSSESSSEASPEARRPASRHANNPQQQQQQQSSPSYKSPSPFRIPFGQCWSTRPVRIFSSSPSPNPPSPNPPSPNPPSPNLPSPNKGGHSLRKRARVDYTLEHIDDEVAVPSSSAAARSKRRKPEVATQTVDEIINRRYGTSVDTPTPTSRRRNPVRKPSEGMVYTEPDDINEDENDVQDTIEVGVSYSDSDSSDEDQMNPSTALTITPTSDHTVETPSKPSPNAFEESAQHGLNTHRRQKTAADAAGTTSHSPDRPSLGHGEEFDRQDSDRKAPYDKASAALTSINMDLDRLGQGSNQEDTSNHPANHIQQPSRATTPLMTQTGPSELVQERVNTVRLSPNSPTTLHAQVATLHNGESEKDVGVPEDRAQSFVNPEETLQARPMQPENLQTTEDVKFHSSAGPSSVQHSSSPSPSSPQNPVHGASLVDETPNAEPVNPKLLVEDVEDPSPKTLAPESAALESKTPDAIQLSDGQATFAEPAKTDEMETASHPPTQEHVEDGQEQPSSSDAVVPNKVSSPSPMLSQPGPVSRWAHLTPFIKGEYVFYPEKKSSMEDDAATSEEPSPEGGNTPNDTGPLADDVDAPETQDQEAPEAPEVPEASEAPEATEATEAQEVPGGEVPEAPEATEAPMLALNTPTQGSPAPESVNPTRPNSPAPPGDEGDEVDVAENQDPDESELIFRLLKVRSADEFISALENYENLSTADLYELLETINASMVAWQEEWNGLGKVVDDYENSLRRRAADAKYEARTRILHQHGINYEEPDFVVKGYKAKEKDVMSETRYLQNQDRTMSSAWGFEYDPHPSKIGRQNPKTQQDGIMTRGRSLRNQPKPTAKATEADEVTGRRQRRPVQAIDPASQDISRSSTPAPPTRGRRRRMANIENDDIQPTSSMNLYNEAVSDGEVPDARRRKRVSRQQQQQTAALPDIVENLVGPPQSEESSVRGTPRSGHRVTRIKQPVKEEDYNDNDNDSLGFGPADDKPEPKTKRRHLLVLKIPKGKNFSEPSSAITDNGDSQPSTPSSETSSSSGASETGYDFRPKRQKRFRDVADDESEINQVAPKRAKRAAEDMAAPAESVASEIQQMGETRRYQKIKVIRTNPALPANRKGTPSLLPKAEDGEEPPKDYKSMTKSEKMSASMKNRWANGNMAGAVEKRKATLAAKKAAQAVADQRGGPIAPKPKLSKLSNTETADMDLAPALHRALAGTGVSFQPVKMP